VKWWKIAIPVLLVIALGAASYLLLVGPRMYDQPHVRAFQARMPPTPEGVVPLVDPVPQVPAAAEARRLASPLQATQANVARGKVYYEYYCVSCHGDKGDGNGPVGESYVPKPADLRSEKVRAYSDGELLRAMLGGVGHEPMLVQIVQPEHHWYLVLYARRLAASPSGSGSAN